MEGIAAMRSQMDPRHLFRSDVSSIMVRAFSKATLAHSQRHSELARNPCAKHTAAKPPVMALYQVGLRPKRYHSASLHCAQGFLAPLEMTVGGSRVDSVAVVRAIEEIR